VIRVVVEGDSLVTTLSPTDCTACVGTCQGSCLLDSFNMLLLSVLCKQ
jgi:hypothetical protein